MWNSIVLFCSPKVTENFLQLCFLVCPSILGSMSTSLVMSYKYAGFTTHESFPHIRGSARGAHHRDSESDVSLASERPRVGLQVRVLPSNGRGRCTCRHASSLLHRREVHIPTVERFIYS